MCVYGWVCVPNAYNLCIRSSRSFFQSLDSNRETPLLLATAAVTTAIPYAKLLDNYSWIRRQKKCTIWFYISWEIINKLVKFIMHNRINQFMAVGEHQPQTSQEHWQRKSGKAIHLHILQYLLALTRTDRHWIDIYKDKNNRNRFISTWTCYSMWLKLDKVLKMKWKKVEPNKTIVYVCTNKAIFMALVEVHQSNNVLLDFCFTGRIL